LFLAWRLRILRPRIFAGRPGDFLDRT